MLRKVVITLFCLVTLVVAGLGILLGPAHVQIRKITEVLPDEEALLANEWLNSTDGPFEIRWINTATQDSPLGTIGHVTFVIRWRDGKAFLIDAGMNREDAIAFGKPMETLLGASPTEVFGPVEEQMGEEIEIIKGIGFTHLHSDHTSGISAICSALGDTAATIFQTSRQSELQNLHTTAGQAFVNESACNRQLLSNDLIKSVPGFPGLVAVAAGGHTPGSTIFAARANGRTWVFGGDITNRKDYMLSDTGKGFLYSYLLVPENTEQLGEWRQWLRSIDQRDDAEVIISHDINATRATSLADW